MYLICPKCGFRHDKTDAGVVNTCPACGLVFSKWMKQQFHNARSFARKEKLAENSQASLVQRITSSLLSVDNLTGKGRFYGYALIYLCFFLWGWSFILADLKSSEINSSFMHNINLVFHEAGHVLFGLFGNFMAVLGGSLLQLLVPFIVMMTFILKHRDNFAASIGLWWLAQSMMDLVPYINDARKQEMWLLGGVQGKDMPGIHDWNNILSRLNLLEHDETLAILVKIVATSLMLISFLWGAWLLKAIYKQRSIPRNIIK